MLPRKNLECKIRASWTSFYETLSLECCDRILRHKILSFILLLYSVAISYYDYVTCKFVRGARTRNGFEPGARPVGIAEALSGPRGHRSLWGQASLRQVGTGKVSRHPLR